MEAMPNRPPLSAAIDIGSNSFRLLIAELNQDKAIPLYKRLDTVRLAQGLAASGKLHPDAMIRAFQVFSDYQDTLSIHQPAAVRACGTAALRQAENRTFFLEQSIKILGVPIEIISGEEEALLALRGAASQLPDCSRTSMLLMDIGGGSTELIWTSSENVHTKAMSFPLGAVNLTASFLNFQLPTRAVLSDLAAHLEKSFYPFFSLLNKIPEYSDKPPQLIATGGTATALAALSLNLASYDSTLIQGCILSQQQLITITDMLLTKSPAERNRLPGLNQNRGEIILGGAAVIAAILRLSGASSITISDAGLIEGILLSTADNRKNVFTKREKSHIS